MTSVGKSLVVFDRKRKHTRRTQQPSQMQMLKQHSEQIRTLQKVQQQDQRPFTTFISANIDVNGTGFGLSGIALGDRDGDSVSVKSIHYRFHATRADSTNFLRFIICIDTQANGTLATPVEILTDAGDGLFNGHKNYQNRKRFRTLKDKTVRLDTSGPQTQMISGYIPLKKKPLTVTYGAGTTAVMTNEIVLLLVSDSGVVPDVAVRGNCRLIYNM